MVTGPQGAGPRRVPATPWRRRLDLRARPVEVLRLLRGRAGLVGLLGAWCGGGAVLACEPAEVLPADADPFEAVAGLGVGPEGEGLGGGWIGLWGYQLGRLVERLPDPPPRPLPQRDHWLARYDWVLRLDRDQTWWFESLLAPGAAGAALERVRAWLSGPGEVRPYDLGAFTMVPEPADHVAAVAAALEHIVAGDIFQANVCARLGAELAGDPLDVFCRGVEALAPAYAAFVDTGDRAVVSLSPELFLRRRGRQVLTSPIKGTVPIDQDPTALAASAKDRAENVMIVDLMRNDLGRVCEPGSIAVPALARAEARAGVWHLVSDVTGTLRAGATDADLLRATFPPGSVTGAPKVRAMEVITEVEATGRELYTGAIGYASPVAGLETSVVIRTLEAAGGRVWLGVGGGVVADSVPEAELAECFTKAAPVLSAVGGRLADSLAASLADSLAGHLGGRRPLRAAAAVARVRLPPDRTRGRRPDASAGVFTTVLALDGRPLLAAEHAERLCASAAAVLGQRLEPAAVEHRLRAAAAGTAGRSRVRLAVAGDGSLLVTVSPAPADTPTPWRLQPVVVPGGLGGHKWTDRRLLDELASDDADDLLLVDRTGCLLETGRGNLFVVHDDGVHTPRVDGRILPGVARAEVLALLARHGVPTYEHDLALADLGGAAEVFVTNSVRGVLPVGACAGVRSWPVGPTTAWLGSLLDAAWRGTPLAGVTRPAGVARGSRVLLVDNYDSFAWNLAQYAGELGAEVTVVRNDAVDPAALVAAFARDEHTHLVISPGPGRPEDAGFCVELVRRLGGQAPVLGVCLGHQCIATAYGARVVRAAAPVHGKPALVHHDGRGVFTGLDGPCVAARYHSLVVEDLPPALEASAWTADGTLMGLRHRSHPVEGIQMHPESILTPLGHTLLANHLGRVPGGSMRLTSGHGPDAARDR